APLLAFLLPFQVVGFELAAVTIANLDAVELQWAPDEEAVADEPGVFAALAPDLRAAGAAHVEGLALVEDVLLQLLPVLVALRADLLHERVEVRRCAAADMGRRPWGQERPRRREST